jgi:hypothetical protein
MFLLSCKNNVGTNNSIKSSEDNSEQESSKNENSQENNECKYKDGTHSATVEYTNPETGYNQTYTLDVEVENCEIIQINFPKGGWLDIDHITPSEIDNDGSCTIEGEEGRTYEIQIDN